MPSSAIKSKRSGFTLIELLVVIAIIAILAAILFPVFAKAREKARQTSCLSQTKQLGLGFIQYYQDYDEKLPAGTGTASGATVVSPTTGVPGYAGIGWGGQIYSEIKSVGIYKCPDDSTTNTGSQVPISYAMNSNTAGQTQSTFGNVAKSILLFEEQGIIADPTSTTAPETYTPASDGKDGFSTSNNGNTSGGGTPLFATGQLNGGPGTVGTTTGNLLALTGRHTDGSNFLLADGHSKWFRGAAVSPGVNNTNTNDCGLVGTFSSGGTAATTPAGDAASTSCSDAKMGATFSVN